MISDKPKSAKEGQKAKNKSKNVNTSTKKSQKRGWSHIIGKVTYSAGPGDNIYVFG